MRTLGIDLSAQAKRTATCAIDWSDGHASVGVPHAGAEDEALLEAMHEADWIGIDAPFGWPDAMVRAVRHHAEGQPWPESAGSQKLRYRATDWFVQARTASNGTGVWPLSVSSDRIAVCAWRCASLLSRFSDSVGRPIDRTGAEMSPGRALVEVYPAAALAMWGLASRGYKRTGTGPLEARRAIVEALSSVAGEALVVDDDVTAACIGSDDALDALVASLVARAAATGDTLLPDDGDLEVARREGWIHLPERDSLARLVGPAGP